MTLGNLPNRTWTGTGSSPAPTITVKDGTTVNNSFCPGMEALEAKDSRWECLKLPLDITVDGDVGGCPWLVSIRATSQVVVGSVDIMDQMQPCPCAQPCQLRRMMFHGMKTISIKRKHCLCNRRAE